MPLELIHSDLSGPFPVESLGGYKYFLTFIDDFTHYTWTYLLVNKSDVAKIFQEFLSSVELESGQLVKILRTDGGREYLGAVSDLLKSKGIKHQTTTPYTPQQNGVSERMNRTLCETMRCMMHDGNLPQSLWGEAIMTVTYLRNRCPTSVLKDKTPYEAWTGKRPDISNLRAFGCVAYKHVPDEKRDKLAKSEKCRMVCYGVGQKGWKLWNPKNWKIITSADVLFNENDYEDGDSGNVSESNQSNTEILNSFVAPTISSRHNESSVNPFTVPFKASFQDQYGKLKDLSVNESPVEEEANKMS